MIVTRTVKTSGKFLTINKRAEEEGGSIVAHCNEFCKSSAVSWALNVSRAVDTDRACGCWCDTSNPFGCGKTRKDRADLTDNDYSRAALFPSFCGFTSGQRRARGIRWIRYIGYFYRCSRWGGSKRLLPIVHGWIRRLGRAWAESPFERGWTAWWNLHAHDRANSWIRVRF